MKGCDWDGLHEYEAQFFGFLPKGFTDVVYNLILEEWAEIVEKKIMPNLPLEDVSGETKLHLKMELVNMIGKNNILNSLMNKLEAYTLEYIFRIPDEVTLPEDRPNLKVDKEWNVEVAINRRRELERDIIKLRLANELFDKETENNLQAIQLWKAVQEMNDGSNFVSNDFSK
ncbi:Mis12 family protein [Acanthocheilonema viteae]